MVKNGNMFLDICEKIEKTVYSKNSKDLKIIGIVLVILSLLFFIFSGDSKGKMFSLFTHSVIVDRMPSAIAFLLLHVLTVVVLLIPKFPDKFQFATLFTFINIILFFRVIGVICYDNCANLSLISFFILMICWLLFGLEATRCDSRLLIFKLFGRFNARIQKKYDQIQVKSKS